MNANSKIKVPETEKLTGLALLRAPFPPNQISKLPKESRKQADERKARKPGCMVWDCPECKGAHHKDAVHLDYVGHAALTDRLLECDPEWNWEPVVLPGLPNPGNGMWIKLTVCGVSRIGYGDAGSKTGGDAIKEVIGDALRNAAMRFGAALDLWHKGVLHAIEAEDAETRQDAPDNRRQEPEEMPAEAWSKLVSLAERTNTTSQALCKKYNTDNLRTLPRALYDDCIAFLEDRLAAKTKAETNRAGQSDGGDFNDINPDDVPF